MQTIELNLPNGYRIKAIETTQSIFKEIWQDRIYDQNFEIQKGMTILDLGANQGFFSLYAASKGANVISIEPEAQNFQILTENICNNALESHIKAYRYAVSNYNGEMELYLHNFNVHHASVIVSSSLSFLKSIQRYNDDLQVEKVPCITLDQLFKELGLEKVDLLKIDCEGAELEILKGASHPVLKKINYMVMEIHNVYPAKILLNLILKAGFQIISYQKWDYQSPNGYLFAANQQVNSSTALDYPVAIMNTSCYIPINKKLVADGSHSYSLDNSGNNLRYHWFINGELLPGKNSSIIRHKFNKTGLHELKMEIMNSRGLKDKVLQKVLVLKPFYFNVIKSRITLNDDNKNSCFVIKGKKYFSLKLSPSPIRRPICLCIAISYQEPRNYSAAFEFNGQNTKIKKDYQKIMIPNFPLDLEARFKIIARTAETVKINWWYYEIADDIIIEPELLNTNFVVLGKPNEENNYTLKNRQKFLIHHDYFRQFWYEGLLSLKIQLGIAIHGDTEKKEVIFQCQDHHRLLTDSYQVIDLILSNPDDNFIFSLTSQDAAYSLEILWWLV